MSFVLSHVSFAYADAVPVLTDITHSFEPGWHALVGANGAGKTTLLRILAGEISPDAGTMRRVPAGLTVQLCPQSVERLAAAVEDFATSIDGVANRVRGLLALEPHALSRWPTLSPGERKRWQVGAMLAASPGVLLLDEPTNHLDGAAREQLVAALSGFDGIGIVVSHDRDLLNALISRTLRLEDGALREWPGCYDVARSLWEAEARRERDAYEAVQHRARGLERRLREQRERRAQAASRMRTSTQMKNCHDSDARGRFKQTRRRSAEAALARDVRRVRHALDGTRIEAARFHVERAIGRDVPIRHAPPPVPWLLRLDEPALEAGGRVLLRDVHMGLGRDDRVRLHGSNGAGKTTMLRALTSAASIPRERLLHLPQELDAEAEREALAAVRDLQPTERGRALALLAGLGVEPARLLSSRHPSPGEARKLVLAMGLAREVWAVVLDEPTNHLDLPSIERLQETLSAYPGALLLVTHDDALARAVAHTRWAIVDGRVEIQREM